MSTSNWTGNNPAHTEKNQEYTCEDGQFENAIHCHLSQQRGGGTTIETVELFVKASPLQNTVMRENRHSEDIV